MTQEEDLDHMTFDQFAETLGMEFTSSGAKLPFGIMDNVVFRLLMLHYNEKSIAITNIRNSINTLKDMIEKCETIEQANHIMKIFIDSINQSNTQSKIIPMEGN